LIHHAEKSTLIAAYLVAAVLLGINPVNRPDWALENLVPFLEGIAFVLYAKWRPFSFTRLAWYLVFVHLLVQVVGGHYTYERGKSGSGSLRSLRIPNWGLRIWGCRATCGMPKRI
jgi:uncharacterized membrane protein YjdF